MAKLEMKIKADYARFVDYLKREITGGSISASLEEESYCRSGESNIAVLAFERYSYMGGNRVGMTVTLIGKNDDLVIIAVSTGGSKAVFFKINTFGEEAFLDKLRTAIKKYSGE